MDEQKIPIQTEATSARKSCDCSRHWHHGISSWLLMALCTLLALYLASYHMYPRFGWTKFSQYSLKHSHGHLNRALSSNNTSSIGHFLHITDIHLDLHYSPGAEISAKCHRHAFITNSSNSSLVKDTRTRIPSNIAGKWGSPGSGCDTPVNLVEKTFDFIKKILMVPENQISRRKTTNQSQVSLDFIIWTGDNARHDNDRSLPRSLAETQDLNIRVMQYMLDSFSIPSNESTRKTIPILPVIGNNDIHPKDALPYTGKKRPNSHLDFFAQLWSPFVPESQIETFKHLGCFVRELSPGIWGVSLNTLYLSSINDQVSDCTLKPDKQKKKPKKGKKKKGKKGMFDDEDEDASFTRKGKKSAGDFVLKWLEDDVLKVAQQRNITVLIAGHVAPSSMLYYDNCYKKFSNLMLKYESVIKGHFYGHQNLDHFYFPIKSFAFKEAMIDLDDDIRTLKSDTWVSSYFNYLVTQYKAITQKKLTVPYPVMVAPSVIPVYNPGVRVLHYKKSGNNTGSIFGYDQFFANLTKWNSKGFRKNPPLELFYEHGYSTHDTYGMAGLDTTDWLELAARASDGFKASDGDTRVHGAPLRELMLKHMMVDFD